MRIGNRPARVGNRLAHTEVARRTSNRPGAHAKGPAHAERARRAPHRPTPSSLLKVTVARTAGSGNSRPYS